MKIAELVSVLLKLLHDCNKQFITYKLLSVRCL